MTIVAPSILSADFSCLKDEILKIEEAGADWVHIDAVSYTHLTLPTNSRG